MKQLALPRRFLIEMANGTRYEVEPIEQVQSAMHGPCLRAWFRDERGYWEDGSFRLDLIVSMQLMMEQVA